MKHLFFITGFTLAVSFCQSQDKKDYCTEFYKVIKLYSENSYRNNTPEDVNINNFFNEYIQTLDPNQVYFSNADYSLFKYVTSESENLSDVYCKTMDSLEIIFKRSLNTSLEILNEINTSTLDFNIKDSLYTGEKYNQNNNKVPHRKRWINYIKYQVLKTAVHSTQEFDSFYDNPDTLNRILEDNKHKIIEEEQKRINNILNTTPDFEYFMYYRYINTLLMQLDPHTFLFSKEIFSQFQEELNTEAKSYGIRLETNQYGKYFVSAILPGSYAWRTGEINVGDEIIQFQVEGKDPIYPDMMNMDDITEYINSGNSDKLSITLKNNTDGQKHVTIYRESLQNQENSVQSFILKGKKKIGYILLPAFYTSWESDNSFGCAQDIAKAIYELKKEKIEGLILDLRNNGGGSIKEAIELAGIFIDFGTLIIQQNRNKELNSLRDFNRGVMYSGPLAVMTNKKSASASEIVAAILQDYNRAIIIGDNTFGKASGQILIPLSNKENSDVLKVTQAKYYRVNGKTHQKVGVNADIRLPQIEVFSDVCEKDFPMALENDSIDKNNYYRPLNALPIEILKEKSSERVDTNQKFQQIKSVNTTLKQYVMKFNYMPLDLKHYYSYLGEKEKIMMRLKSAFRVPSKDIQVENLPKDKEHLKVYKYFEELNSDLINSAVQDPYIEESYFILNDFIILEKN